jgi:hypothetical protein
MKTSFSQLAENIQEEGKMLREEMVSDESKHQLDLKMA